MKTIRLATFGEDDSYINIPLVDNVYAFPYFDKNRNLYTIQCIPATEPTIQITFDELDSGEYSEYAAWFNLESQNENTCNISI